jgi:predicted nucleic acid-binding Zn ribbon protein
LKEAALPGDDPKGIGEILEQLKRSTTLGEQLEFAEIWRRWPEVAGDPLFAHGQPRGVRDGRLYVEVESPVWMHKYAYARWDILARINAMAGRELVSDLFVVLQDEEASPPSQDRV